MGGPGYVKWFTDWLNGCINNVHNIMIKRYELAACMLKCIVTKCGVYK